MTRKEMNSYIERVRRFKTLCDKLIEMYDGLGTVAKASIEKLMPKLSEAIKEYKGE